MSVYSQEVSALATFGGASQQPARYLPRRQSFRIARINKQLQREISLLLEQRVKNDIAKNAVITGVECARDLEFARVYFTTVDPGIRESVLAELRSVKGAVRTMLGQVLKLRHIPALDFMIDSSHDYGEHIDGILHRLGLDSVASHEQEQEEEQEGEFEDEDEPGGEGEPLR